MVRSSIVVTACVSIGILAALTGVSRLQGQQDGAELLCDEMLARLHGRTSDTWCRAGIICGVDMGWRGCDGSLQSSPPPTDPCDFGDVFQYPEYCLPDYGNETCPGDPPTVNVLCKITYACYAEKKGKNYYCTNKLVDSIECEPLPSYAGCVYDACPI